MTYAASEVAAESYPTELYQFNRGLSESYNLTSSNDIEEYNSESYFPIQIERGAIQQNSEIERAPLDIKIQRDADLLDNFVQFPPTEIMTVTIFRFHANDGATPEVALIWSGRVLSVTWSGSQATLACEPVFTSLKRPGLRRLYQAQCPHVLYGTECGLNRFVFAVTDDLTVVAGAVVTAPAFINAVDFYFGGYVVFENRDYRTIIGDDGAGNLTLNSALDSLVVGSTVTAFPGCAHDLTDCGTKFSNVVNYGGFPYVPSTNPFGGTILF